LNAAYYIPQNRILPPVHLSNMNGFKADPHVKADDDAITPSGSGYMDDDFYEDTGELSLPIKGAERDLWLTRIPDWLYEKLSNWDDLAVGNDTDEIVLGDVLAFPDPKEKDGISKTQPMRMFFNEQWHQKAKVPNAFELERVATTKETLLKNTYIFTEKDLPGYKHSGPGQNRYGNRGAIQDPNARIQKRSKYKKAIPKQTVLIGNATRQFRAAPLPTKEFLEFDSARHRQAIQGAYQETNVVARESEVMANNNVQKLFNNFIKSSKPRKSQLNKAARMPRNELMDWIHKLFDEYEYWSMKALKHRTKQPEAFLKEVLTDVAQLIKSGTYASQWKRKAHFGAVAAEALAKMAPKAESEDEDDSEEEMEDVV
jgi:transcription initiation factor TFIIF subunit beta